MTQYVFVLGTGRCGSTLVQELLARHPSAAFVSNLEDRSRVAGLTRRWNNPAYRMVPPGLTRKGRLRFAPTEGYRALDRDVSPILSRPFRDLTAADATPWLVKRTRSFFEQSAQAQGRPVFLHKFTGWPRAGFLAAVFPEARFIHVVRDGRAVANSWLQMDWWEGFHGPDHWQWGPLPPAYEEEWRAAGLAFPTLAALLWKLLMDAHGAAARTLPANRWMDVRFEDVIGDPKSTFAKMLAFSGLAPDTAFDRHLGRVRFDQGRKDAFQHDLGPDTVATLTRSLRSHLERLGYLP